MVDKNENEWMKWLIRTGVVLVWGALITVLTTFNTRISDAEKSFREENNTQSENIATLSKCQAETKIELAYIKMALSEQNSNIREILKAVKQ